MDAEKHSIANTVSPALAYEQMLLECGGTGDKPTEAKMILVFKVLDQIVPHLGVFTQLAKMLRDELFSAVYSDEYTSSADGHGNTGSDKYIQKVPYFQLVKHVHLERDETNEMLTEKLELLKQRLLEKQQQWTDATQTISDLEQTIHSLNQNIADLENTIQEKNQQINDLEQTLDEERTSAADTEHQLSCDISELRDDLTEANNNITFLTQYKTGYDQLQQSFVDRAPSIHLESRGTSRSKTAIATRRSHLVSGIENCHQMELQLLTIQNTNIEEFDKFLEDQKRDVLGQQADDLQDIHDVEMELAEQQLQVKQDRFQAAINDIVTELKLLRQHRLGLTEQLQVLEQSKQASKKKDKTASRPTTQESSGPLTRDLQGAMDEEEQDGSLDPFAVQERIFSKFAAMLYTSENGKTFHEFKGAKYCQSCGEKTVLCPHKILQQEHTFLLPPHVSHIKIIRPKVRINANLPDRAPLGGKGYKLCVSSMAPGAPSQVSVGEISDMPQGDSYALDDSPGLQLTPNTDTTHYSHTVQRLWEDYRTRTDLERVVARPLSCAQALSLVEQFSAHLLWLDTNHHEGDKSVHVLDSLYNFMVDRYLIADMAYLVTFDLFTTLTENISTNKMIWLFVQTLIGNLDASVLRYILLIGDFINSIDWKVVEDFRAFSSRIYPTLTEDDLETLQMGYVSFSENKISTSLVADYIIYMIIKYREPRFLEMENILLTRPGRVFGMMMEAEFVETTDAILDVPDNKLRMRLYGESLDYVRAKDDPHATSIPNLRVGQISSYLQLLDIAPLVSENIAQHVDAVRQQTMEPEEQEAKMASHKVPSQSRVIGLSEVINIGENTARRHRFHKSAGET